MYIYIYVYIYILYFKIYKIHIHHIYCSLHLYDMLNAKIYLLLGVSCSSFFLVFLYLIRTKNRFIMKIMHNKYSIPFKIYKHEKNLRTYFNSNFERRHVQHLRYFVCIENKQ